MVVERRMIRWMCDYILIDNIRNEVICNNVWVVFIEDKIREFRIRLFGYVIRKDSMYQWGDVIGLF